MKKIIYLLVIFSFTTNFFAQPFNMRNQTPREKFGKYLNLTQEQQKKFDELNYNLRKSMIDIRSKIQKNRLELKKLFDESNIDEKKILQLVDDNSKLQAELKSNRIKNWLDIYKMLDKDQQQKWIKAFQKFTEPNFMKNKMKARMKDKGSKFPQQRMK